MKVIMKQYLPKVLSLLLAYITVFLCNKSYAAVYRWNVDWDAVIGILFVALIVGIPLIIIWLVKNSKKTKENLKWIWIRILKFIVFSVLLSIIAAIIS